MKFSTVRWLVAAILALIAFPSLASEAVDKAVEERLRANLAVPKMGLSVQSVKPSDVAGMYEVQFANGPLVYATAAGDFFIAGDLYSVTPEGFVNLGEQRRDGQRREQLAAVADKDMIIFSPEGEPRGVVTVFTDISCFYCQKLHKEVPELNRRGVEVRYLAYPRAGVGSDGYRQLVTAWCAENQQDTLTRLKSREAVPEKLCDDNPVAAQYRLGQEMGVRGTPAMVTDSGKMIPGYQSADDLMVTLGLN